VIYRIGAWIAAVVLLFGSLAVADDPKQDQPEPPARFKKKDRPRAQPAPEPEKKPEPPRKDEAKKKDGAKDEPGDVEPGEDPRQILDRLSKNMKDSADRLAKADPSDPTRQVQRDILKDLDALLNQDQQQQQQGGSSEDQKQADQKDQKDQKNSQQGQNRMASRRRAMRNRQARGNRQRQQNQQRQQEQQANNTPNPGKGGNGKKGPMDKRPDAYKDIWGHLPEALRMQMDAYGREKFMAKYDDLLKQYYATIAEKERR
jgi:colicin import membrane protein